MPERQIKRLASLLGSWLLLSSSLCVGFPVHADTASTTIKAAVPIQLPANFSSGKTEEAASRGDSVAQFNLAWLFENGWGYSKDDKLAVIWYRKAAEQGNAYGQNNLGTMYFNGSGVPKDDAQAVAWYQKAAEQGHSTAQSNLGFMYKYGLGVPRDDKQAEAWYRKAAEQSHTARQRERDLLHIGGGSLAKLNRNPAKQPEAIDTRSSIYGLILGAPLPLLNNCDAEPRGSKAPMCLYNSPVSPPGVSPWGTQTIVVSLNEDVFDHSVSYGTRYPTLELVDGKIVGILFEGLVGGSTDEFLALLSQKFGKYRRSGDTYSWATPAANVRLDKEQHSRLVTTGQVDLLHPFGEGISSEPYFANTITIYTPAIRYRIDAYRAEQALKNKKQGF